QNIDVAAAERVGLEGRRTERRQIAAGARNTECRRNDVGVVLYLPQVRKHGVDGNQGRIVRLILHRTDEAGALLGLVGGDIARETVVIGLVYDVIVVGQERG